jgi:hypothetical protein
MTKHTPSSAVNFRRSSSAKAPGAPSGMMKMSFYYDEQSGNHERIT